MKRLLVLLACVLFPAAMAQADNHSSAMDAPEHAGGEVNRAIFTVEIQDREPVLEIATIPDGMNEIFLFTELMEFQGQTVTHRWHFDGNVESEISFDVGGPRWRVWSRKSIPDSQRGEWSVDIIDGDGYIVETYTINAR